MKITRNTKSAKGMTLLELTVVILVLLSLIAVLFVGARAWKKGSDRAASILVIRNIQQAVRSVQNMNNFNAGDVIGGTRIVPGDEPTLLGALFGSDDFYEFSPVTTGHPAGGSYTFAIPVPETLPPLGTLYLRVTGGDTPTQFEPISTQIADW
jgi:type II secretory pathway pseudopilin PulG